MHGIEIKSCNMTGIREAWEAAYDQLKVHGEAPNIHILDNKCPNSMKLMFKKSKVAYQLVPPHIHRRNVAERAIRTFNNYFVAAFQRMGSIIDSAT